MSAYIKAVDGIVECIHGLNTTYNPLKYGDKVPYPKEWSKGEIYFQVENPTTQDIACSVTRIDKAEYVCAIKSWDNPYIPDLRESKVYFRYHRGSLLESIKTAVEVKCIADIQNIIKATHYQFSLTELDVKLEQIKIEKYGPDIDLRIGWKTFIVCYQNVVIGFLSGELNHE